jgi:hypothetical protein
MITHANDAVGHFGLDLLVRAPDWLGPAAIMAATVPGPSKVNDSGAVDVDQDFALAHPKDDGFVGFGAGIPLTVHHAPGMRTKSPGPPSTLSVPPGPNSSRRRPCVWNT